MSARDDLVHRLNSMASLPLGRAEELVDAFAHELAERIRNSKELRNLTDDHMSDCNAAADLIDP